MITTRTSAAQERIILVIIAVGTFLISSQLDLFEQIVNLTHTYETYELDELIMVCMVLVFCQAILLHRRWASLKQAKRCLENQNHELQEALAEIRQLKGIIPICASCKKIRDDQGYWHQVEAYLSAHSEARFSHGICPACMDTLCHEIENTKP
ncbi:hypothetical protein [Desulfoluna spongiiphila]|uniref:Uncharacterized protein n=1 Tax=Desulfoluna spongiiphila TaxID=419481 RepID=A0A1G5FW63_9BACT|nr:hypothetical protein [Desulfoluna spongiiphila]SCY43459.1 hypothetical protein SAMN05216233_10936 [Desulfoluna spongiiphila]VVS91365.1 hypothetical protein DBB_9330 [Desulfoluna spongiiphila]